MSYIIEERTEQSYHRFDMDLYMDYRRTVCKDRSGTREVNHPLSGAYFIRTDTETGVKKIVRIVSTHKHWWAGYYIMAVYVTEEGSHGTTTIENINSICDSTISEYVRFQREFVKL